VTATPSNHYTIFPVVIFHTTPNFPNTRQDFYSYSHSNMAGHHIFTNEEECVKNPIHFNQFSENMNLATVAYSKIHISIE
jgi:hypothetical protein